MKTEYTSRAVVWFVNIFNCFAYNWTVKDRWKVTWHGSKYAVELWCIAQEKKKEKRYNKYLLLIDFCPQCQV